MGVPVSASDVRATTMTMMMMTVVVALR